MPKTASFEAHPARYEAWFVRHEAAYLSELLALRPFVPWRGQGIEIGVGSGRFAAPLGIWLGVDPSRAMLNLARARGIAGVLGAAEHLPFATGCFDCALIVTTICFVDSPTQMLAEAHRVLAPGGRLVVGFIDRASTIGQSYLAQQAENIFYRDATFYSAEEVIRLVRTSGFTISECGQTLSCPLSEIRSLQPLRSGYGLGSFVVISAMAGGDSAPLNMASAEN